MNKKSLKPVITALQEKKISERWELIIISTIFVAVFSYGYTLEDMDFVYIKFLLILMVFGTCLFFLLCERKPLWKAKYKYKKIKKMRNAQYVLFTRILKGDIEVNNLEPVKTQKIEWEDPESEIGTITQEVKYFHWRKLKYFLDPDSNRFKPVKPNLSIPMSTFGNTDIHRINLFHSELERKLQDKNKLDFPLPDFMTIYTQQLMEPLNFFQFFSVILWVFDDGLFFPLTMLGALMMTNFTVCIQRMTTILSLRSLRSEAFSVRVLGEDFKLKNKSSEDLLPGDIIVVKRSEDLKIIGKDSPNSRNERLKRIKEVEEIRSKIPFGKYLPVGLFEKMVNSSGNKKNKQSLACDLLILRGTAVVDESILTGENIPQIKSGVNHEGGQPIFDKKSFKGNILFAGCETLQLQSDERKFPRNEKVKKLNKAEQDDLDKVTLGMVMSTGFRTSKGKITRTVLFSEEDQIVQKDCYILLFLLLIVSLFTSAYVMIKGLEEENRNKDKLFLRCIMIITNVVPPELPMIMNMAVNGSILNLKKKKIFCTDPFRIILAGKVDTMVFDKTGTLTQDSVHFKGVGLIENRPKVRIVESFYDTSMSNKDLVNIILSGCHSLLRIDGKVIGDPIEKLYFENSNFKLSNENKIASNPKEKNQIVKIQKTFPFRSELKRMTTVVETKNFKKVGMNGKFVVSKGAPEIFETLPDHKVPKSYRQEYLNLAEQGFRLLSLFAKPLKIKGSLENQRTQLETGLEFQGFLILENRLKKDTPKYIKKFAEAGKRINILSGDNLFTCVKTFKALDLDQNDFFQMNLKDESSPINIKPIGECSSQNQFPSFFALDPIVHNNIPKMSSIPSRVNLCTDGKSLAHLLTAISDETKKNSSSGNYLLAVLASLRVIGRVSPSQKELYINLLRRFYGEDSAVLMCGDGNNDVGALKSADVGIALVGLNDQPSKKKIAEVTKKRKEEQLKAFTSRKRFDAKKFEEEHGLFDTQDVKFGDASIAAPFTNKISNSIKCVSTIIKQGVCTLVCGFQTYKIVTLGSLISAYTMSTLHLENLKFSDYQNTYLGIYGAFLNYFLTNGLPEKKLSNVKPPGTIRNIFFWLNLFGQLSVQLYFSYWAIEFGKEFSSDEDLDVNNEEEFTPTFLNSVMFIYNLAATFCIYVCNYEGYPFMQPLSKSKLKLLFALSPLYFIYHLCYDEESDISQMFQLDMSKSTSEDSPNILFNQMLVMIGLTVGWTYLLQTLRLRKITRII